MTLRERLRRRWLHWVVVVGTVGLLAIFARSVHWRDAWQAIVHANLALVGIATLANLTTLVAKGIKWSLFLDAIGIPGVSPAVNATIAAAALNGVVVANGGDAARVAAMARRGNVSSAAVLATLAVDRFCDLVAYAVLFVVAAFVLPLPAELARWRIPGVIAVATLATLIGVFIWRSAGTVASAEVAGESLTLFARIRSYWRRLVATSASIATGWRLVPALALAFVGWAGQWATYHYAAHAAAFPVTPAISLLALLVVNASFLFRLTPGNLGIFQLLYAVATASTGLDRDSAVAVAFLIQMVQYIPVTIIGLLLAPSLAGSQRPSSAPDPPGSTGPIATRK